MLRGASGPCRRAGNCGKGGRACRQSLRHAAAAGVSSGRCLRKRRGASATHSPTSSRCSLPIRVSLQQPSRPGEWRSRPATQRERIRLLAPVEGEITHTRDGAALLADAARAIGLHQSASRYDLAALICRGGYDSHGNDCAPIDLTGKIADDERMPQSLYLEGQSDGSVICNAGGIYYRVNPFFGHLLLLLNRGRRLSTLRSLGPSASHRQRRAIAEIFEAATARLRLLLGGRFPNAFVPCCEHFLVSAWSGVRRFLAPVLRLAASIDLALVVFLYRLYRRLPVPVRAWTNKIVQSLMTWLRPLVRDTIGPLLGPRGRWRLFSPISESHARGAARRSALSIWARPHLRLAGASRMSNGATPRVGAFLEQRFRQVPSNRPMRSR